MATAMNFAGAPQEERDLARACTAGDRDAQTRLYRGHVQQVHGLIHRVLGPSSAVEDLVQETFIRLFRSLAGFRGEAHLGTWIGRIALRVAYEHLRGGRPETARLESVPDLAAADAAADEQLAAREGLRRVYRILDRLDAKYRIAFTLHVIDGRPQEEVASLMDATVVATKARIWRARRDVEKRARQDALLTAFFANAAEEAP